MLFKYIVQVFVDRAPIPEEANSLVLIIVIVVIVLLVVVITGKLIVVMMIVTTGCNVEENMGTVVKKVKFFHAVYTMHILIKFAFCSCNAGGVCQEEREMVLQLVKQALHQPRHHREERAPCPASSLWQTKHKLKKRNPACKYICTL